MPPPLASRNRTPLAVAAPPMVMSPPSSAIATSPLVAFEVERNEYGPQVLIEGVDLDTGEILVTDDQPVPVDPRDADTSDGPEGGLSDEEKAEIEAQQALAGMPTAQRDH